MYESKTEKPFYDSELNYFSLAIHQVDALMYLSANCHTQSGRVSALKNIPKMCRRAKHHLKSYAALPSEEKAEQLKLYKNNDCAKTHSLICYDDRAPVYEKWCGQSKII